MPINQNYGRPKIVTKFKTVFEYLQEYVFPEKDILQIFKENVVKKEKELSIAQNKKNLQQKKIDNAYENLKYFTR